VVLLVSRFIPVPSVVITSSELNAFTVEVFLIVTSSSLSGSSGDDIIARLNPSENDAVIAELSMKHWRQSPIDPNDSSPSLRPFRPVGR
jgi:hypothetical protein